MAERPDMEDWEARAREHFGVPAFLEWPDTLGKRPSMLEPLALMVEPGEDDMITLNFLNVETGELRAAIVVTNKHLDEARQNPAA